MLLVTGVKLPYARRHLSLDHALTFSIIGKLGYVRIHRFGLLMLVMCEIRLEWWCLGQNVLGFECLALAYVSIVADPTNHIPVASAVALISGYLAL